jgi:hypothetical protein
MLRLPNTNTNYIDFFTATSNPSQCQFPFLSQHYYLNDYQAKHIAIDGDIFAKYHVITEFQCADYCLRHILCVAFNYQFAAKPGEKACELLSAYRDKVHRLGFIYEIYHREKQRRVSTY